MESKREMPVLSLDIIHAKAVRLSGVMNAVAFLENQNECAEGKSALIFLADELSRDLERHLDELAVALARA